MPKKFLTASGRKKLEEEVKYLKEVKRKEVAARIDEAKQQGDLSENGEYQDARDEQAMIEGRVREIETMLKEAIIIDDRHKKSDKVCLGSTVMVEINGGEARSFTLTGSKETDPISGLISNESPMGQSLLGSKVGEIVKYNTPEGEVRCKITELK